MNMPKFVALAICCMALTFCASMLSAEDLSSVALPDARFSLKLPAQHAAMALIGKKEKGVIAKYGF